jgi:hypothetical protein
MLSHDPRNVGVRQVPEVGTAADILYRRPVIMGELAPLP